MFDSPAAVVDNTGVGGRLAGYLPLTEGWMKTAIFGAKGDILPASVGGSSTTQFCDYFYAPELGSGWRALVVGGLAYYGSSAGPFCSGAYYGSTYSSTLVGARLFAR